MKKPSIDLSEFLPKGVLDDLLPPEVSLPTEVLSPPEMVQLRWLCQVCSCGREFEAQEYGPLIRHTLSRRLGFGVRPLGKVFIPWVPGMDVSDLPQETITRTERIFACPSCLGARRSAELFPDQPVDFAVKSNGDVMPPHVARWKGMHDCSMPSLVHQTEVDMAKRQIDFNDLLAFRTTEVDLKSAFSDLTLCDPEKEIEL